MAEAYVRRSTKASAFLHTRVRPPGPREPAPRAVLLLEPRGKVVVGFGRASVTLRTGSVKARGKTRVKCRRWRKEGTQLFLRPHSGTKLEVDQLNEKGAQLDVVLNDKVSPAARLRIRGEAGRILVIPRIGPPPAGTQRLRSLMGAPPRQGERRGRRWRRGE